MSDIFAEKNQRDIAVPIIPIACGDFASWREKQNTKLRNWLQCNNFKADPATFCLLPDRKGQIKQVFFGVADDHDCWSFGVLSDKLPEGHYYIKRRYANDFFRHIAVVWGLGAYRFARYKVIAAPKAKLVIPAQCDFAYIENMVTSIYLVRDLINTPAEDMGPAALAKAAVSLGIEFNADVAQTIGDDLVKKGFNAVYAVGKGSTCNSRLIDLTWGKKSNPKITLVGKGVCFDAGGLDLKTSAGMALMKKDMAGAAHVLGLARMIMAANLPLCLRVIIPAVENMVSGSSYKPGDVIKTFKGITVEVSNTDAEGRLILADALALASEDNPDLLVDFASLTGAARVALGTDIAALFSNSDKLAAKLLHAANKNYDEVWRLPLFITYKKMLDSKIAELKNCADSPYGGAIVAALFLQEFISPNIQWAHFDVMACNLKDKPGRPQGGDAAGLRGVFDFLRRFDETKN